MDGFLSHSWHGEDHDASQEVLPFGALSDPRWAQPGPPAWLCALPGPSAIVRAGGDGFPLVEHANPLFSSAFGDILTRDASGDTDIQALRVAVREFLAGTEQRMQLEMRRNGPLGNERFMFLFSRLSGCPSDQWALLNIHDRTAQHRMEESLRRELVCDSLTTLPNRAGFGEEVEQLVEQLGSQQCDIMVMVVDLLRFSRINESLGSMQGDELILAVARRLTEVLPDQAILARLGGDEFAICMPLSKGITETLTLFEQIKAAIAQPVRLANFQLSVDCAIGCSIVPAAVTHVDELVRQAQSAVRTAKQTDRLEVYRAGGLKEAQRRFLVESRLREALVHGGLTLVYQPLIDLSTNAIIGFEALTRWRDEELGNVSPVEFIEVAEDCGLIVQLGRWALNEAMQQLARWDAAYGSIVPLKMNVNLSPLQIARDDVIGTVAEALRLSGVEGRRLMLELTESALVGDPAHCRQLLSALKQHDVAIAMDDFGTGYSNMATLQSLPIDVLKIDRSFVTDMLVDDDKRAIIRAILSLAEALKLSTTAEGIETGALADALKELGCTTGQGYYFARPMTADDAWRYWMARWNFETI